MKRVFLSVVTLLAVSTLTLSAGGKLVEPPYSPPIKVVTDEWSGPYIGAQIGYIKGEGDSEVNFDSRTYLSDTYIDTQATYSATNKPSGFIGGLYAGYNKLLTNNWLLGVELAANYTNIKKSATLIDSNNYATKTAINLKQKGEVALYGKFGKVLGEDSSTLLYGLVGVSGTKLEAGYETSSSTIWDKDTVYGLTVGSGLEFKLNKKWHARVQYRFSKYDDANFNFTSSVDGKVKDYKTHSVMVGVSYHF